MIEIRETKRGELRYRVRLMIRGKKISKTFKRRYDAQQFEKNCKLGLEVDRSRINFKKACEDWMAAHSRLKNQPGTIRAYQDMFKNHIYPLFEKRKLMDIEPEDIDRLIQSIKAKTHRGKPLKNSTVNRSLQLLRTVFNFYMNRRVITFNPIRAVGLLKVEPIEHKFWNQEEVILLLEHVRKKYAGTADHSIYLFYKVAVNTGLRLGELLGLQWSDIDLSANLILVSKTRCNVSRSIKATTKGNKISHVPISDAIRDDLIQAKQGKAPTDPVFERNGKRIDPDNFRRRNFKKDLKECGIQSLRIHDTRHTFGSHFMMNGGALYELQAFLSHSSPNVTQRYAHLSKAFLQGKRNVVAFTESDNVIKVDFAQKQAQ